MNSFKIEEMIFNFLDTFVFGRFVLLEIIRD